MGTAGLGSLTNGGGCGILKPLQTSNLVDGDEYDGYAGVVDNGLGGERQGVERAVMLECEWTRFVHYGARYLMRVVRQTKGDRGRFIYDLYENGEYRKKSYNVLRHAGAVFAMASYIRWAPSHPKGMVVDLDELTEKTAQAVDYLKTAFMKPFEYSGNSVKMLALWDEPNLIGKSKKGERCAKLGGAGLGLVALTSFEAVRPGTTKLEDLLLLAEFVKFMQRDDGGFESKYCEVMGMDEFFVSLYYPGEASLGLVQLYELTGREEYLRTSLRAILYLANLRATSSSVEPDHWAMLATEKILKHLHVLRLEDEGHVRELLLHHGDQVLRSLKSATKNMLVQERKGKTGDPPKPLDGRPTPIATRLEGFMAALSFSKNIQDLEIRENAYVASRFLISSQVLDVDESNIRHGGIPAVAGGSDQESKAIRIDYVQHAICGIMRAIDAGIPFLGPL